MTGSVVILVVDVGPKTGDYLVVGVIVRLKAPASWGKEWGSKLSLRPVYAGSVGDSSPNPVEGLGIR